MDNSDKLNPADAGRELKRVAGTGDTREEPAVVPIVVVAVAVHVTLVVPAIEREVAMYGAPSMSLLVEYSPSCTLFGICNARALHTKYLHFLKCLHEPSV